MNKLTIGLSLAALAIAGTAQAQAQGDRRGPDADANGTVTRAEVEAHAAQAFARADVTKDGKLDAADREARRVARTAARFDRLDADGNGQISRDEFGKAPLLGQNRSAEAAAGQPRDERRMGRRGIGRGAMAGMRGGAMADANKDGAVAEAEFIAGAVQRFERMDANKDGNVTTEERRALRGEMRRQRGERRSASGA